MKQIQVRLPDDLAEQIDSRAEKVERSRNDWIVRALRWAVEQPIRTVEQRTKL
jgi:metal-responsive CopG/Arc/MetJ family transcriptional regulator